MLLSVLKEERDDTEIIRGALETLVSAITPIDTVPGEKNEVRPASMNADLLCRESESISLLLSLLVSSFPCFLPFFLCCYNLNGPYLL